jgi:SAM-dependent methyltransferase
MHGKEHGHEKTGLPELKTKPDEQSVDELVLKHIQDYAQRDKRIEILEAGCGRRWPYDLSGICYTLTGIDINAEALRIRQENKNDLHNAVVGDLGTVHFGKNRFDIIYSAFVLEHVSQARLVLAHFLEWLKPGGLLILKFPDRDSVYGFVARITPFWCHVLYKKHLVGNRRAGQPGFGPFPTAYGEIIARSAFRVFIGQSNLIIREEYGFGTLGGIERLFAKICSRLSFGRLTPEYHNLLYILETQPPRHDPLEPTWAGR